MSFFAGLEIFDFCRIIHWNEEQSVLLCREALFVKTYQFKPTTTESGDAWYLLFHDFNVVYEIKFCTTQKDVRDIFRLLHEKHSKNMLKEETASGSNEKETELHNLLQNLKEEYEGALQRDCEATAAKRKKIKADTENATNVRKQSLGNTF